MRLPRAASSLEEKNFRYFWLGQMVSLVGTWMQTTAQGWLVLRLTNSAFLLGLVTAVQFLPLFLFSLQAGDIADRLPKKSILYLTQSSMMVLALVLGILTLTGTVRYWHILILAGLLGAANALDTPARQSFISELVERKSLMNAITLNSAAFNAARMVGPALAGLTIGSLGMAWCFFLNAASFLSVLFGLALIRVRSAGRIKEEKEKAWLRIAEGLRHIRQSQDMTNTIWLIGLLSTLSMNFSVLVPVLAKINLNQGAEGYGFLMSAMGIGSLAGALFMAAVSHLGPRRIFIIGGGVGLCLFQLLLAATGSFYAALILLGLTGWMNVTFITSANSRLQIKTPDSLRGRIMSVYSLVFLGVSLPGSLISGGLAHLFGAPAAFALGAAGGLLGMMAVFGREILQARGRFTSGW